MLLFLFHDVVFFAESLVKRIGVGESPDGDDKNSPSVSKTSQILNLFNFWSKSKGDKSGGEFGCDGLSDEEGGFRKTIVSILTQWAKSVEMRDDSLVESLFLLLFRQYDEVKQVLKVGYLMCFLI